MTIEVIESAPKVYYEVSSEAELIAAIETANVYIHSTKVRAEHIISINAPTLEFDSPYSPGGNYTPNAVPWIDSNIVIEGNDAILSTVFLNPPEEFRFFDVRPGGRLTLRNLTLKDNHLTTILGSIQSDNPLTLENCTLKDLSNNDTFARIIHSGSSLTLTGCTIDNCFVPKGNYKVVLRGADVFMTDCEVINISGDAAAIVTYGEHNAVLKGVRFEGNTPSHPLLGTNPVYGGDLILEDCEFINNAVTHSWGLLWNHAGSITINNCYFDGNSVQNGNGLIYTQAGTHLTIVDSRFLNTSQGRTMYLDPTFGESKFEIRHCLFQNQQAGAINIGGIEVADSAIIQDCEFINNQAKDGAAISASINQGSKGLIIQDCRFEGNVASNVNASGFDGGFGGALDLDGTGPISIINCKFVVNKAGQRGGAITSGNGNLNLSCCDFIGNSVTGPRSGTDGYGAAIYLGSSAKLTASDLSFFNNQVLVPSGRGGAIYSKSNQKVAINRSLIFSNKASGQLDGVFNDEDTIIIDARDNWWGSANGPSDSDGPPEEPTGTGDGVSNNVDYTPFLGSADLANVDHDCSCDCGCYVSKSSCNNSTNPIALLTGEKRIEETDISISIPGGTLAFTRTYRQNKQDEHQLPLGLGWSHNHQHSLTFSSGDIIAHLAGGEITFKPTAADPNRYEATPGSTSVVEFINNEYILTSGDKSQFLFDTNGVLTERKWPGGMRLLYDHNGPNGEVSRVYDPRYLTSSNPGSYRRLVFSYYDPVIPGHLASVTDHTGRHVSFTYDPAVGAATGKLLARVIDVRNNVWEYTYYGVGSTENWLHKRVSPPVVDKDGDSSLDTLDLEELSYTLNGSVLTDIQQQRGDGLLTTDFAFPTGISGEKETLETIAGSVRTHHFSNGLFTGTENGFGQRGFDVANGQYRPALRMLQNLERHQQIFNGDIEDELTGNWTAVTSAALSRQSSGTGQVYNGQYALHVNAAVNDGAKSTPFDLLADETYELSAWVYVVTGTVKMDIPGVTGTTVLSTTTNQWEKLSVPVPPGSGSTNKHLQFTASGGPAEFYVDDAAVRKQVVTMRLLAGLNWGLQLIDNGNIEEEIIGNWSGVGGITPTRSTSMEPVAEGSYSLKAVATSVGQGVQSTAFAVKENTRYQVTAQVYVVDDASDPEIKMHIPGDIKSEVRSKATLNDDWQTLTVDFIAGTDISVATLQLVADTGAVTFYVDDVLVIDKDSGHQVNGATDALGNKTQFRYDTQERLIYSIDAEGRKTLYVYDDTSNYPRLATEIKVIDTDQLVKQWQKFVYDTAGNVIEEQQLDSSGNLIQKILREYYTDGVAIGFLKSVTQVDLPDEVNNQTTTYFYDPLGRVIQTNQSANLGGCTKTRTIYDAAGNVVASLCNFDLDEPDWESGSSTVFNSHKDNYAFDEDPSTYWSANGGVGQWISFDFGAARSLTDFSLTAREDEPVEMPKAFTLQASHDLAGWDTIETFTLTDAWQEGETRHFFFENAAAYRYWRLYVDALWAGNTTGRVSLAEWDLGSLYYPSTKAEAIALRNSSALLLSQNRLTLYEYDAMGRPFSTITDAETAEARETRTVYDSLSRVTLTVNNFKNNSGDPYTWTWNDSLDRWEYDDNGTPTAVNHGPDGIENRPSATFYNDRVQVWKRIDPLGTITLFGYDEAGRQVKVIRQASDPDFWDNNPTDYALEGYIISGISGEDLISQSVYDEAGNLVLTVDEQGNRDVTVFDDANRVVKTVRRVNENATILKNPGDVDYKPENDPRSAGYVPVTDPDQDLITLTEYDAMGRTIRTRDEVGNWTLYGYDALGRQVRTIASASQPFYDITSNPQLTLYDDTLSPTGYPLSTEPDEDIVAETIYDDEHRVESTAQLVAVNADGTFTWLRTRFVYDGLGRQIKTITNFKDNSGDPSTWTWNDSLDRWEYDDNGTPTAVNHGADDENIIAETVYDSDGRVFLTRDVIGRETWQVYDEFGRRVKTITNYVAPTNGADPDPATWVWDDETDERWEDPAGVEIPRDTNYDQNVVSETVYDLEGRVESTRNALGNVTRFGYDAAGRRSHTVQNYYLDPLSSVDPDPANWIWQNNQWEDGSSLAIPQSAGNENLITQTVFDAEGRVKEVIDPAGNRTRYVYDTFGRRIFTIVSYVSNGIEPEYWFWDDLGSQWAYIFEETSGTISHGTGNDENLISETLYDQYGRVSATRDVQGIATAFAYDRVGRRINVIQASGQGTLETSQRTVFDKAGRALRVISNITAYDPDVDPPLHAKDELGNWLYNPTDHGANNDQDLITEYRLDKLGRVIETINPVGDSTQTVYDKDGRVVYTVDPMGVVQALRYDGLRRLVRVVANFVSANYAADPVVTYADPGGWVWESGQWKDGPAGVMINHDPDADNNDDTNITAEVTLDRVGRKLTLRDPRGYVTSYEYDRRDRRTKLTNPLSKAWTTQYKELSDGRLRLLDVNPVHALAGQDIKRTFDRAGRLSVIRYPDSTPDVIFDYDVRGNRTGMREEDGGVTVRDTDYVYDKARRLTQVDLDRDGAGSGTPETVKHTYSVRGLRTKVELPGGDTIDYSYDARRQLIAMDDWGAGKVYLWYDAVGRLRQQQLNLSPLDLDTYFGYDPAGRLLSKKVVKTDETLASFAYEVDARGNRTRAVEALQIANGTYVVAHSDPGIDYDEYWTEFATYTEGDGGGVNRPEFKVVVLGKSINLTFRTGANRGQCNILLNGTLVHEALDMYSPSGGEITVNVTAADGGPHVVLVRGLLTKNAASSGYKIRFKELDVPDAFDVQTVQYTYDPLSRLLGADYYHGENLNTGLFRQHAHEFDASGNREREKIFLDGSASPGVHNRLSYDAANQLFQVKDNIPATPVITTLDYDEAGRLELYGTDSFTWDAEGRLLTARGVSYTYNGLGQRIGLNDGTAYDFILDTQPGLYNVLRKTWNSGANTQSFVHGPTGILRRQLNDGTWREYVTDGLGSVRQELDSSLHPANYHHYEPYGEIFAQSAPDMAYGFTGEPLDSNDFLHLRARYLLPELGVFPSLDPLEGGVRAMSALNRYAYVAGNVPNIADPSGMIGEIPRQLIGCQSSAGCSCGQYSRPAKARGVSGCVPAPYGQGSEVLEFNDFPQGFQPCGHEVSTQEFRAPITCGPNVKGINDVMSEIAITQYWGPFPIYTSYISRDVRDIAKDYANCLLCRQDITDLEKLAVLSDFVSTVSENDHEKYLSILTEIILEADAFTFTAVEAVANDGCAGWGRSPNDCPQNAAPCGSTDLPCQANTPCPHSSRRYLLDTGFHADFQDSHLPGGGNQIFHLWASVATVGSSELFYSSDFPLYSVLSFAGASVNLLVTYGGLQVFHEGIEGALGHEGSSVQDLALTDVGIHLGILISRRHINTSDIGNWLRHYLGQDGPGWNTVGSQLFD